MVVWEEAMLVEPPQPLGKVMASLSGPRRARGLLDIPQYSTPKTGGGMCVEGEVRGVTGSVRIHHLTGVSPEGRSRFPKLEDCAHFHYEHVELGPIQVSLCEDESLRSVSEAEGDNKAVTLRVTSSAQTWLLRRTYDNFHMLDQQLHRCVYDRKFSNLTELPETLPESQESLEKLLSAYLARLSIIAGSLMNCGPVLSWLELDNRGRRLLVTEGDSCPINTPAVAAAYSIKKYTAVAADEISFDIGDMISVIDMPPPEESTWWRGKRGFLVGFFPSHCVAVITEKLPRNLNLHQSLTLSGPTKPVLRKHGKLIAFFRAFILSRPSRRRLKQSGILKERVFGCDLGEHLLNSSNDIPMVLKCCSEFIESHGIVDGIYRLSGVTSNIQKLRRTFDEDRVPALYEDEAILQDIHSVASLLKMYFRELPNPLCTYQLYSAFVLAVQTDRGGDDRLLRMREAVEKLPPPHYRTLEYLMRHLARVSEKGAQTGMTARNVAIVWAPNLLRCKELEVGGVAALQGVGVQAVVTEFLIIYADLIFCSVPLPMSSASPPQVTPKRVRPKSLAISTPTKLLSLEEAQNRALGAGKPDQDYIEVGGGPSCLPAKYHTVIELPRKRAGSKRSPLGWKSFFSKTSRATTSNKSPTPIPDQRKVSAPIVFPHEKALTESDLTSGRRRLRPVKSAESLASGQNSARSSRCLEPPTPPSPPQPPGHNRSVSHDSYFDTLVETPHHLNNTALVQEEDEEGLSLSLDLSELQVNFDLEESEMRIFSEDETNQLFSSRASLVHQQAAKKQPLLARAEDSSSDPSPKKHKTGTSSSNNRSKRSRLEERLSNAELRYIDSGSPDQVQTLVEVHGSPSLADANVSENETLSFSGLTTPDTPTPHPHYTPLTTEDSLSDIVTTPEYRKLIPSPFHSPSTAPYKNLPRNRLSYQGERVQPEYENLPRDRLSFQEALKNSDMGIFENRDIHDNVHYENLNGETFSRIDCDITSSEAMDTTSMSESMIKEDEIKYDEIKESSIYESVDDEKNNSDLYENVMTPGDDESELYEHVMRKGLGSSYEEISAQECLISERLQCGGISSSCSMISPMEAQKENEYECLVVDSSPDEGKGSDSNHNLPLPQAQTVKLEENVYEDVQVSLPDSLVYQQVKYLQRSVHEINQLLEESMEPFTGEDVSSLEEEVISTDSVKPHSELSRRFHEATPGSSDSVNIPTEHTESVTSESVSQTNNIGSDKDFLYENSTMDDVDAISTSYEEPGRSVEMLYDNLNSKSVLDSPCEYQAQSFEMMYESQSKSEQEVPNEDHVTSLEMSNSKSIQQDFSSALGKTHEMNVEYSDSKSKDSSSFKNEQNVGLFCDYSNTKSFQESLKCYENIESHSIENNFSNDKDADNKQIDSRLSKKDSIVDSKMSQEKLDQLFNGGKNELKASQDSIQEQKLTSHIETDSSNGGSTSSCNGRNVQELMTRFEWSHSEKDTLPLSSPKTKLNRQNSRDNTPNLTTSLDASSFPSDSNPLTRVKTSPDLNHSREDGVSQNQKATDSSTDSDAIRRERIEKYKEERRTFLRKKYRTDSFNNNDDKDEEMIRRLKLKANVRTSESGDENVPCCRKDSLESMDWTSRRLSSHKLDGSEPNVEQTSRLKELEGRLSEDNTDDKSTKKSPSKTLVSISYSPTKAKSPGLHSSPNVRRYQTSETERLPDRIVFNSPLGLNSNPSSLGDTKPISSTYKSKQRPEDLNLTAISSIRKRDENLSPKVVGKLDKRIWITSESQTQDGSGCKSPDESLVQRRVHQLSSSSGDSAKSDYETTVKRKSSLTDLVKPLSMPQRTSSGSVRSPTYCIRDMAAMFENRDPK